jgi:hypothetical protein
MAIIFSAFPSSVINKTRIDKIEMIEELVDNFCKTK